MAWSVRSRRWKPNDSQEDLVRCSKLGEVFHSKGPRHTHPYSRVLNHLGLQHSDFQAKRGGRPIIQPGPKRLRHTRMSRIRRSISTERSAFSWMISPRCNNWAVYLYLWPAASMTNGGARVVWSGVRRSIASAFFSDTVRPAASKTVMSPF